MNSLDFDEEPAVPSMSDGVVLETTRRLTRSTPDLTNRGTEHRFMLQNMSRSRSKSPRSSYLTITSKDANDEPSDDSGVDINGHTQKEMSVETKHDLSETSFMYTPMLSMISQEASSRELSGPQKKILSHLQQKSNTADGHANMNKGSRNDHYAVKQTLPLKFSSTETKGSHNFVEHVVEIHKSQRHPNHDESDFSDDSDRVPDHDSPSGSPQEVSYRPHSFNTTSWRSRPRSDPKERSRSRSKSKSKVTYDFQDVSESNRDSKVPLVRTDLDHFQKDFNPHQNQKRRDVNSKQTPSNLYNPPFKPRSRQDKSPFRRLWGNLRHSTDKSAHSIDTSSRNSKGTLTINGQLMSSAPPTSGNLHLNETPQPALTQTVSAHNHKQQLQNEKYQGGSASTESHTHRLPIANHDASDDEHDRNGTTSKPETTSKTSKRAMFASTRKGSTNEFSPTKVGGVISSRYKSPRRDKQISKINVPLIKIESASTEKTESASRRQPPTGRNNDDVTEGKNFLTVKQSSDVPPGEQKLLARVTISDQLVDTDTNIHSSSATNTQQSSSVNTGKRVTSISVGGWTSQDRPENSIDVIKKKAREKYGEIPLDVVYIYRSKPTLGVAIEGGANTRQPLPKVISVQPGGSAYESGGLKVGHVILEVNGKPAVGLSHMDAARLIAEAFKNRNYDRMELLVTEWSDMLLDTIRVDVGLLKV